MAELYIYDSDDNLLTVISESTGLISTRFRDEINSVSSDPFVFTVDANEPKAKHIKEENRVIFQDKDGDFREFVIKEVDDIDNIDETETQATCLPAWLDELSEHYILDKRYSDKEAQLPLDDALEGTRYTGEVTVSLGLASTNFYRESSVDCIWKILKVWGGEFKDKVEFTGNKITTRKIVIKQRLGADKGARFDSDYNIEQIERTVLSYPKTAMYGYGASLETEGGGNSRYIDFGDVEWKVSNGDPVDKPKGQTWVSDPDALLKYGRKHDGKLLHRYAQFSNQDYEEAEELLMATWLNLQANKEPIINYKLSVGLLDKDVSLGDTATAIDREFARPFEIQTRVIAIEYDLLDIEGTTIVEMGQFIDLTDDIYKDIEDLKEAIKKPRPNEPITDESIPDTKPSTPTLSATGLFESIMLEWEYDSAIYIGAYEVYGSQTKDFIPQSQHLLWRGKTSAFTHKVKADQTWYYRIRAVNTRGTASEYSNQATASTVRIMTDDILFGAVTAEKIADLAITADKLADGTINFDKLDEDIKDAMEQNEKDIQDAKSELAQNKSELQQAQQDISNAQDQLAQNTQTLQQVEQDISDTVDKVEQAQIDAQDAKSSAQSAVDKANTSQEKADQALTKAQEGFDKAQESFDKIDNLTIGARNYLANKNIVENSGIVNYMALVDELISGKVKSVTLSTHGYSYGYDNRINFTIVYDTYITDPNDPSAFEFIENPALPYTHTVEGKGILYVYVGNFNSDMSSAVFPLTKQQLIDAKFKLETGTVPTDWTEAPEDTDQKISVIADDLDGLSVEVSNNKGEIASVKQTAQGLQTKVQNAEGNISDLIQTADGLQTRVQDAEGEISTVKQTAQGLQSRVETVENWEFDGTNLLRNSKYETNEFWGVYNGATITGVDDDRFGRVIKITTPNSSYYVQNRMYQYRPKGLEKDEYVTISFYVKGTQPSAAVIIRTTGTQNSITSSRSFPITSEWKKVVITEKILMSTENLVTSTTWGLTFSSGTNSEYYMAELQVVKGNKSPLSWSPAPEDTDEKFSAITQTIDSISTRVQTNTNNYSSLTQTVSGIQTEVNNKVNTTTYNSKMTQLDNAIAARITTTDANNKFATQAALTLTENSFTTRIEKVESTTGNLVKNPELTGDLTGWNSGTGLRTMVSTLDEFAGTTVLRNESTADTLTYSDWFDVDPSKSYEISMWVRKSAARGRWYLGVHGTDKVGGTTNDLGFTQVTKAGTEAASPSTNFYFVSGGSNAKSAWVKLVGYLMPNGTSGKDMAGLGENNQNNAIMSPNLRRMRVRWLNYENGGTNTYMYVAHPKVVEVSSGVFSQISQLDNAINLRVEKNNVINQINVSTEGILLDGAKVHIKGTTTIDNGVIKNAHIGDLNASKIDAGTLNAARIGAGSIVADKLATNAVTAVKISANAVTTDKINAGAVVADKIATNAITAVKINANAVTSAKISAKAITADKLAVNSVTAENGAIASLAVGTAAIANLAVTNGKIANLAITTGKIQDAAITNAKIGDLAVDTANIASLAVTNAKIADLAVTNAKIANLSVTNAKIGTAAITTAKIADAAITNAKINSLSVDKLTGMTSSFVSTLWNGVSSQVSITGSGLETYSGGQRTSLLDGSGQRFYRNNLFIGTIGTSYWTGDTNYRGLRFGLENNANYMSWGFKNSASDTSYTTMLAWHKTGSKTNKGFTFSDHVRMTENVEVFGNLRAVDYVSTNRLMTNFGSDSRELRFANSTATIGNWSTEGVSLRRGDEGGSIHWNTDSLILYGGAGRANILLRSDQTSPLVLSTSIYNRTYSGQSTVVITGSGTLGRLSSARKYKLSIENQFKNNEKQLEHSKRLLDLNVRSWFDKAESELLAEECKQGKVLSEDAFKIKRHIGLVAEEVESAGLSEFVIYGDDGQVEGIAYEKMWIQLIPILKNHEQMIELQQKTIDNLQLKIAEMETR